MLSLSCPFCYVSFLRTKWLYYYFSMSEMQHTKQNKRNWGWKFKRHLEKSTENTLYSLDTCKDYFFTFYWKSCTFTEPNVRAEIMSYGLEKSVICAILQKTIMIMSFQFCQLLCKYITEIPSSVRISLSTYILPIHYVWPWSTYTHAERKLQTYAWQLEQIINTWYNHLLSTIICDLTFCSLVQPD